MKSPRVMYLYGLFLALGGVAAFALAGFEAKAVTALIPVACGVLMVLCGLMAAAIHRSRAVGMIGIHAGLVLPLLFAAIFANRGYQAWQGFQDGNKPFYLPAVLFVLLTGSVVAFMGILATRPPKAERV